MSPFSVSWSSKSCNGGAGERLYRVVALELEVSPDLALPLSSSLFYGGELALTHLPQIPQAADHGAGMRPRILVSRVGLHEERREEQHL